MRTKYNRRQFVMGSQIALNKQKLEAARSLVGKRVLIDGVARMVTGFSGITGEAEVRVGVKTRVFDPLALTVVEDRQT